MNLYENSVILFFSIFSLNTFCPIPMLVLTYKMNTSGKVSIAQFALIVDFSNNLREFKIIFSDIYCFFKMLCKTKPNSGHEPIKCLSHIIKYGPLYKLPVDFLRQEFNFIENLCANITSVCPKPQQEALIELVYEFCKHVS